MTDTCRRGHPFTPDNTYRYPTRRRECRQCRRAADLRRQPRRDPSLHDGHKMQDRGVPYCLTCWRGDANVDEVAVERAIAGDPPERLSVAERELAIADLTAAGFTTSEIAARVGCTRRTVARVRARLRTNHERTAA